MSNISTDSNNEGFDFSTGIPSFIVKTVIVSMATVLSLSALLPDIPRIPETERNKLILLGLIQNPNVLWKLSELEEAKGKFTNSITYMEAAIGLLEMNDAREITVKKYQARLDKLIPLLNNGTPKP
jgi:hypothetical protein